MTKLWIAAVWTIVSIWGIFWLLHQVVDRLAPIDTVWVFVASVFTAAVVWTCGLIMIIDYKPRYLR